MGAPEPYVAYHMGEMLAEATSLRQLLDVLDEMNPGCDVAVWQGGQLLHVRMPAGTVLKVQNGNGPSPPAG